MVPPDAITQSLQGAPGAHTTLEAGIGGSVAEKTEEEEPPAAEVLPPGEEGEKEKALGPAKPEPTTTPGPALPGSTAPAKLTTSPPAVAYEPPAEPPAPVAAETPAPPPAPQPEPAPLATNAPAKPTAPPPVAPDLGPSVSSEGLQQPEYAVDAQSLIENISDEQLESLIAIGKTKLLGLEAKLEGLYRGTPDLKDLMKTEDNKEFARRYLGVLEMEQQRRKTKLLLEKTEQGPGGAGGVG